MKKILTIDRQKMREMQFTDLTLSIFLDMLLTAKKQQDSCYRNKEGYPLVEIHTGNLVLFYKDKSLKFGIDTTKYDDECCKLVQLNLIEMYDFALRGTAVVHIIDFDEYWN